MKIANYLNPARTVQGAPASSKKKVLQEAANLIASDVGRIDAKELFRALMERERLGSTGIGEGVAIPHCRIATASRVTGALIQLENAIDFQSIDSQPVDLLFILLVPDQASDEHLQVLSQLASRFNQADFRQQLRAASTNNELYECMTAGDEGD